LSPTVVECKPEFDPFLPGVARPARWRVEGDHKKTDLSDKEEGPDSPRERRYPRKIRSRRSRSY